MKKIEEFSDGDEIWELLGIAIDDLCACEKGVTMTIYEKIRFLQSLTTKEFFRAMDNRYEWLEDKIEQPEEDKE